MKALTWLIGLLSIVLVLLLTGCGTTVATSIKTIGLDATIPLYGVPVGIRIGNVEIDTQAVRGNTTYISQTSSGGGLWSANGGTSKAITLVTGVQLNEGYLAQVLQSTALSDALKLELVKLLLAQPVPTISPITTSATQQSISTKVDLETIDTTTTSSLK